MPTTRPPGSPPDSVLPRLTRNTLPLVTLATSIGPSKGIESRGWRLKLSSSLITSRSAQSDGRAAQFGLRRLILSPVLFAGSSTVNRSLGNGPPCGVLRSKEDLTLAARTGDGQTNTRMATRKTRTSSGDLAERRICFIALPPVVLNRQPIPA